MAVEADGSVIKMSEEIKNNLTIEAANEDQVVVVGGGGEEKEKVEMITVNEDGGGGGSKNVMSISNNNNSSSTFSYPKIEFIEDVDSYMKKEAEAGSGEPQFVLKRMEEIYSKIKIIESSQRNKKAALKNQMVELSQTLDSIEELKKRKVGGEAMMTHFRLADHIYLKAKIKPVDKIGLWLGANVMLEYDVDEGEKLLIKKKVQAEENLRITNDTLDKLREQITTIEVNMARVYNFDVMRRKAERDAAMAKMTSTASTTTTTPS